MTWPVTTITYGTYQWLMREVGGKLGFGHDSAAWTHEQTGVADSLVQRGVRAFYTPPVLPREAYAHEWSFLRPVLPMTTVADQNTYDMPFDFAMLEGPMTFAPGSSVLYEPIRLVGEHQIRQLTEEGSTTGRPSKVALRPKKVLPMYGTTYEAIFWPTPDDAYTINYRCRINPADLSETNNFPYGGQPHYESILASCLALADPSLYDQFLLRLSASVSLDRRVDSPSSLGYNVDRSDVPAATNYHNRDQNLVTYNDVTY